MEESFSGGTQHHSKTSHIKLRKRKRTGANRSMLQNYADLTQYPQLPSNTQTTTFSLGSGVPQLNPYPMSAIAQTSSTARRKKLNGHNTLHKFLSTRSQLQDIYQTTPFQLPPHFGNVTTTMFDNRTPKAPHSNRKSKELSAQASSRNHEPFKVPQILTSGSSMLQDSRSMN